MDITKLYFDSKELAEAYSAAEGEYRGCNMESTSFWYVIEEDEIGWYCEVAIE